MKVTPTCKYGHGPLEPADEEAYGPDHYWVFAGMYLRRARAGQFRAGDPLVNHSLSGHAFAVKLFRCAKCGYMEMFDEEVANGSD